jgi:hypothetical protein
MIHWPVGWLNGAAQKMRGKMGVLGDDRDILTYPYHIDTLSMCFVSKPFPMDAKARAWPNIREDWNNKEQERWVEQKVVYCLHGVEQDFGGVREVSREWLDKRTDCSHPESVDDL